MTVSTSPAHPSGAAGSDGAVGAVRIWLRLEGLGVLVLAVLLYALGGYSWALFAILFLAPDLSFVGYFGGPAKGAAVYNAVHSYLGPLLLALGLVAVGSVPAVPLIWAAHIGFDRALGYGLKYPTAFGHTHLGRIGKGNGSSGPGAPPLA